MTATGTSRVVPLHASPLDRPLWFTVFSSPTRIRGARKRLSLREFRKLIRSAKAEKKSDLPLVKLAIFDKDLRRNAALETINGVEGDYDGESVTFSEAVERLSAANVAAFLYSTASSEPNAPRWRVMCPTSQQLSASEQTRLIARVNGVLGGALAPESFNPSQAYFFGCVGGLEPRMRCIEGRYIDECDDLDKTAIAKQGSKRQRANDPVVDRSAVLFRIAREHVRRGATIEEFEKAARSDEDAAGHLDDHPDDKRAIKRAWEAAQKSLLTGGGDIENGRAFAARYAGEFMYLMDQNIWCHWTGTRWAKCERGEHIEAAKQLAEDAFDAANAQFKLNSSDVANANRQQAAKVLFKDKRRIEAMLALARAEPQIVSTLSEFDQNHWLFGVRNGVVDLQSCELIEPNPKQKTMRASRARFEEHAGCPKFEAFLKRVLPNAEERVFLQRLVGYTLTGTTREEIAVFLYGSGANGKSIFANILTALFGDYCVASSSDLVVKTKHDTEFKRELFRLKGARLSLVNEVAKGDVWDDKKLKDVASREIVATRALYAEGTHYIPTHVVWIRGNHMPDSHDMGEAFWRRLVPIHFAVQIPADERIADLDQEIIGTELSGILNWALDGAADYQDFGLEIPNSIEDVREAYRARTDMLGRWLTECTVKDHAARTTRQDAFKSYERYCASNGAPSGGYTPFCRDMKRRGFKHRGKTGNAVRNFGELRLLDDQ